MQSTFHIKVGEFTFDEDKYTQLWISFEFFWKKFFFPKFELLNLGCSLSLSEAYLQVFPVFESSGLVNLFFFGVYS